MKFLVAIHRPNNYDHSIITPEIRSSIDLLNDEMVNAGVRVFVGGLRLPDEATTITRSNNGTLTTTDGPYLQSQGYVDGIWILDVATYEEAVEWGRRAASACQGSVEVRPFH